MKDFLIGAGIVGALGLGGFAVYKFAGKSAPATVTAVQTPAAPTPVVGGAGIYMPNSNAAVPQPNLVTTVATAIPGFIQLASDGAKSIQGLISAIQNVRV